MDAKSPQLCPTLCDPMDCSPPGSCVHGVFQARYWSGLPCLPPGDLPHPGMEPASLPTPVWAGGFFTTPAEQPYRCSVHLVQQVGLSLGYLHPVQNGSAPHFLDAKAMCNSPNGVSAGERFPTDCLKKREWRWKSHGPYSPWSSSGQNTGVGSFSLLQGIFPPQGWNPGLPHCRRIHIWAIRELLRWLSVNLQSCYMFCFSHLPFVPLLFLL